MIHEARYRVGERVVWNDPDGDETKGWTIQSCDALDNGIIYVIVNKETRSEAEVLEREIYLDDNYETLDNGI